jgi:glycosyltransferase involved in cell wall biosynthesis
MRSLYFTYSGMTEPLGRAQVLPYLFGLSARGAEVHILSFEPVGTGNAAISAMRDLLAQHRVTWDPMVRSASHDLSVKLVESSRALTRSLTTAFRRRPDIVHARSYVPAAVFDVVSRVVPGAHLLFDCRGMLGDEYVDAGHWTHQRVEYKMLKAVERRLFRSAHGAVVLTHKLERWLRERDMVGPKVNLEVIPCCVDLDRFSADPAARAAARAELGVAEHELVVLYSGSLGTWYLERDMVRFFTEVKRLRPNARLVVLSQSKRDGFEKALADAGHDVAAVAFRAVAPADMPRMLTAGDIGLSFIMSCFSKMGSSPTKVAEYLAAGLTAVLNGDIGDQADLRREPDSCVVLPDWSDASMAAAASRAVALAEQPYAVRASRGRTAAERHFSLAHIGVPRYERLYQALAR